MEQDDHDGADDDAAPMVVDGVLDLHTFSPADAAEVVTAYLDECSRLGIADVRIIHGKGRGVLRRIVHGVLTRRDDVAAYQLAEPARGGWGATLVTLRCGPPRQPGAPDHGDAGS